MRVRSANPEPIRHSSGVIHYEIAHRPRVTRRIHLELADDGRLRVVVPRRLSRRDVHQTLQGSAESVARFLERARARQADRAPLRYVQGERHLLFGRRYPLEIRRRPGGRREVAWMSDRIRILSPERPDAEEVKAILLAGYRDLAWDYCSIRLRDLCAEAPWVRRLPQLRLRRMKASWGTCSVDGIITLNPLLMRAPPWCVGYVVAHEICHLREHNHSPRFYALQDRLYPGWREASAHLRDKGHRYLQL